MVNALWELAKSLTAQPDLLEAIGRQDAVASQDLIRRPSLVIRVRQRLHQIGAARYSIDNARRWHCLEEQNSHLQRS